MQLAKVALQHPHRWAGLLAGVVLGTQQIQSGLGIQSRALVQDERDGRRLLRTRARCQRELLVGLHAHAGRLHHHAIHAHGAVVDVQLGFAA